MGSWALVGAAAAAAGAGAGVAATAAGAVRPPKDAAMAGFTLVSESVFGRRGSGAATAIGAW